MMRWPTTTRWPWLAYRERADVGSENRRLGFFHLKEQGIEVRLAGQQHDEAAGAHASHSDDLQGGVDELVAIQQEVAVGIEGGQIGLHEALRLFELRVGEANHHRADPPRSPGGRRAPL